MILSGVLEESESVHVIVCVIPREQQMLYMRLLAERSHRSGMLRPKNLSCRFDVCKQHLRQEFPERLSKMRILKLSHFTSRKGGCWGEERGVLMCHTDAVIGLNLPVWSPCRRGCPPPLRLARDGAWHFGAGSSSQKTSGCGWRSVVQRGHGSGKFVLAIKCWKFEA